VLREALETITDATIRFAQDAIACGAHGVFLATQMASHRILTDAEYAAFGRPYDLRVLRAVRGAGRFNMLHAHGVDLMLELVADYPVEIFNWHDRLTEPGLRQAGKSFPGLLAGGLNEGATLVEASTDATRREVLDAIAQTGGRRLMIAPGCVLRVDTPDAQVQAVFQALASHSCTH
jgi:uroporphyrinogen decarboxylase